MSLTHSVRRARSEDAEAIARVHLASWRAAYAGLLPEEVLGALRETDLAQRWRGRIEMPEPTEARVAVIEVEGDVKGYAHTGPARDHDSILAGATAEVYGFYVHPDQWGQGVGRELMDRVLDDLRSRGYLATTLNVVEANERARLFYERTGWTLDKEAAPWFGVPQVRYRKEL